MKLSFIYLFKSKGFSFVYFGIEDTCKTSTLPLTLALKITLADHIPSFSKSSLAEGSSCLPRLTGSCVGTSYLSFIYTDLTARLGDVIPFLRKELSKGINEA